MSGIQDEVEAYIRLLGQRDLRVTSGTHGADGSLRIESTSPVGEGIVAVEPVQVKDPWTKHVGTRVPYYRITYAGDGDWVRLARSSALDGLLWAMRPEASTIQVPAGDAFAEMGEASNMVNVRITPMDEAPFLERVHMVNVLLGYSHFPGMYLTPPFGIKDLERRVKQVLAYAPLDKFPGTFQCRGCSKESLVPGMRALALATFKTELCGICLGVALRCGGPTLPIEPKGWRS